MEVFRIVKKEFSNRLTSSGVANRWNVDNEYVIYAGSSRSLSTLELVVHRNSIEPSYQYKVVVISIADEDELFSQILTKDLPRNWQSEKAYTNLQSIGSSWYKNNKSLILKVPSVIITPEFNYIINSKHPKFQSKVKRVRMEDFFWDSRLF